MAKGFKVVIAGNSYTHPGLRQSEAVARARMLLGVLGDELLGVAATIAADWKAIQAADVGLEGTEARGQAVLAALQEVLSKGPTEAQAMLRRYREGEYDALVWTFLDGVLVNDKPAETEEQRDEAFNEPDPFGPYWAALQFARHYRLFPSPGGPSGTAGRKTRRRRKSRTGSRAT